MSEVVRNFAVYGEPDVLGELVTMGETYAAWQAYEAAYDRGQEAYDSAVAAARAAMLEETIEADKAYHAALAGPLAVYSEAIRDLPPGMVDAVSELVSRDPGMAAFEKAAVDGFNAVLSGGSDAEWSVANPVAAAAHQALMDLYRAREAAGPAWHAVRDPAHARFDDAINAAEIARERFARAAMKSARADYRARHGLPAVENSGT